MTTEAELRQTIERLEEEVNEILSWDGFYPRYPREVGDPRGVPSSHDAAMCGECDTYRRHVEDLVP